MGPELAVPALREARGVSKVLLEADMPESPKFVGAPWGTLELWVRGLMYSARVRTDGFIPGPAVSRLMYDLDRRRLQRCLSHLTSVQPHCSNPSWHVVEGGYRIHDYDDPDFYNPTTVRERIARNSGAIGGRKSAEVRREKYGTAQPVNSEPRSIPEGPPSEAPKHPLRNPSEPLSPPIPSNGISHNPPSPLTRPPLAAPTADPHVVALLDVWQGVAGRVLGAADVRTAEEWVGEFQRATGEMLATWLKEAVEWRAGQTDGKGKPLPPLRTLALFRQAIRTRYDHVADDLPLRDPPNRGPDVGLVGIGAAAALPARAKNAREVDPDDA